MKKKGLTGIRDELSWCAVKEVTGKVNLAVLWAAQEKREIQNECGEY